LIGLDIRNVDKVDKKDKGPSEVLHPSAGAFGFRTKLENNGLDYLECIIHQYLTVFIFNESAYTVISNFNIEKFITRGGVGGCFEGE
jgi:hypothetical protein